MSAGMPHTVFLHIGLHKTGTTYLQNIFRANRDLLRQQGVEYPGGRGGPSQAHAVFDLMGVVPRGEKKSSRSAGQWTALVEAVSTSGQPVALVSHERLSVSTARQAKRAVASFGAAEVHVIVTARDLARIATSAWQEAVKDDQTWTWPQFIEAIKDPKRAAVLPARGFWAAQDLVRICATWAEAVPVERLHVVTVPPSGSPPELLMERFASVVGFDPAKLTEEPRWANETVGAAAVEVIRRVNERLGGRLNKRQHDKAINSTLVPLLAERTSRVRVTVPPEEIGWMTAWTQSTTDALRRAGYDVVGSLEDLVPRAPADGPRPDDVSESELLDVSIEALAVMVEKYSTSWWQRRQAIDVPAESPGFGKRAQWMAFRVRSALARAADHNRFARRAATIVLRRKGPATTSRSPHV